jgi:hypothetical protein
VGRLERDFPKGDSLGSLPGAKVGGSKPQRLERIVDYLDRMVFRDVPAEASPGELFL